jgi:hypothetical protein
LRFALAGRPVEPGKYTRLVHDERGTIMSDTPAEIRDMIYGIHRATGRVLVNGLGLGVYVRAIARKAEVERIDVVEADADVIALVGPHLKRLFPKKVRVHHADAYTKLWESGSRWQYAWHDIWDNLCTDNLKLMTKLHRKYGRRVESQDSWGKGYLQSIRRRGG